MAIPSIRNTVRHCWRNLGPRERFAPVAERVAMAFHMVGTPFSREAASQGMDFLRTDLEKTVFLGLLDVYHREFSGRVFKMDDSMLGQFLSLTETISRRLRDSGMTAEKVVDAMFVPYSRKNSDPDSFAVLARQSIISLHKDPEWIRTAPTFAPEVIRCKDESEVARKSAGMVADIVSEKPDAFISFSTGKSPVLAHQELIRLAEGGLDFSEVRASNLDEYLGIPDHLIERASYSYYLFNSVYALLGIQNYRLFNTKSNIPMIDAQRYDEWVVKNAPIDLQMVGIGLADDPHLAFRQKFSLLTSQIGVVGLSSEVRAKNAADFMGNPDDVVDFAQSFGLGTLIKHVSRILVIATSPAKKEPLRMAFMEPVTERVPASMLQLASKVTVVVDEAANPF